MFVKVKAELLYSKIEDRKRIYLRDALDRDPNMRGAPTRVRIEGRARGARAPRRPSMAAAQRRGGCAEKVRGAPYSFIHLIHGAPCSLHIIRAPGVATQPERGGCKYGTHKTVTARFWP